jgi:hypothetical protein
MLAGVSSEALGDFGAGRGSPAGCRRARGRLARQLGGLAAPRAAASQLPLFGDLSDIVRGRWPGRSPVFP